MTSRLRALLLSACLLAPFGFSALADAKGSGGYSHSSSSPSSASKAPSFSAPSFSAPSPSPAPRAPSASGYSHSRSSDTASEPDDRSGRPAPQAADAAPARPAPAMGLGASGADRSYNEGQSASMMARMRANRDAPAVAPAASAGTSSARNAWTNPSSPDFVRNAPQPTVVQHNYYVEHHYVPPAYAYHDYGVMNGVFTYYMLSHLGDGGGSYFYNHYDDPGYQAWRADAERQARDNADLRQQLAALDSQLAQKQGQPRDPSYVPAGTPTAVVAANPMQQDAAAQVQPTKKHGHALVWILVVVVILLMIGAFVYLKLLRPKAATPQTQSGTMGAVNLAANMMKAKAHGETYAAKRYRLGMLVTVDPTPMILAGSALHMPMPQAGSVSVTGIGRPASGTGAWVRLHLPSGKDMVIVETGDQDVANSARLFTLFDTVTPKDEEEGLYWENNEDGAIGFKDFTFDKDGSTFGRVWSPGPDHVQPRLFEEEIEEAGGKRTVTSYSMLYARETGAAAPAPQIEFVLLSSIKERGVVEIWTGVDVNTAGLGLV